MIIHKFNSFGHIDLIESECILDTLYVTCKNNNLQKNILPFINIKEKRYPSKIENKMYMRLTIQKNITAVRRY